MKSVFYSFGLIALFISMVHGAINYVEYTHTQLQMNRAYTFAVEESFLHDYQSPQELMTLFDDYFSWLAPKHLTYTSTLLGYSQNPKLSRIRVSGRSSSDYQLVFDEILIEEADDE